MGPGSWVVHGQRIAFRTESAAIQYPSADTIFREAFTATPVGSIDTSSLITDLPNLAFSRVAAEPAVRLFLKEDGVAGAFGVVADGRFHPMDRDRDQIIAGDRWYPIVIEELKTARLAAEQLGAVGAPLRISAIVALRRQVERPYRVIDEVGSQQLIAGPLPHEPAEIVGLEASLYPYQVQGVHFLRLISHQRIGCILADEMGLGKTLQVIAVMQSQRNDQQRPFLVVAPATLLENWRRELQQFAPRLSVQVHAGPYRAGIVEKFANYDVTITSYDTVVRDEPLISSVEWHIVVLDEAQAIKNPSAQRTLACKRLPRSVAIAVSGTPLENRIDDLWSVADFCVPGLLGTLEEFREAFTDDLHHAAQVAAVVSPLILRRRIAEVAKDLPEKIDILQAIEMSELMAQAYELLRVETLAEYGPGGGLVATTRLRSFCAHPSLMIAWDSDPLYEMHKYARLIEILEEVFESGEKVLIFSSFQGVADILQRDLPARFPTGFYRTIDGRTPVKQRQETVDEFFVFKGYGALFLNPKAAGTGLNITAANHVIHFNPEWNPALTAQATARAFRRKQERPVTVHHLYFLSSVEEVVIERADFKKALAQNAVTGHDGRAEAASIAQALQISPLIQRGKSTWDSK